MPDHKEICELQHMAARYHADLEHWRNVLSRTPVKAADHRHVQSCVRQAMGMSAYLSKIARIKMGIE